VQTGATRSENNASKIIFFIIFLSRRSSRGAQADMLIFFDYILPY
jgi:hypothetical protein